MLFSFMVESSIGVDHSRLSFSNPKPSLSKFPLSKKILPDQGTTSKRGDVVRRLFEEESTLPRKHDPMDMLVDQSQIPPSEQDVVVHTVESRVMEVNIHNFGMVQRLWCRRKRFVFLVWMGFF